MMQHDHLLDSTLDVEFVVALRWLNLRLDSSALVLGLGKCCSRYKPGIILWTPHSRPGL